ncbi:hypothetical protein AMECASPLE_000519 [Ameca splendens]|uniref:Uncharacterized protein n=1 Tax=Ameca splendens TaxID=208324 RepID=A0ABV0YK63_9TELE
MRLSSAEKQTENQIPSSKKSYPHHPSDSAIPKYFFSLRSPFLTETDSTEDSAYPCEKCNTGTRKQRRGRRKKQGSFCVWWLRFYPCIAECCLALQISAPLQPGRTRTWEGPRTVCVPSRSAMQIRPKSSRDGDLLK